MLAATSYPRGRNETEDYELLSNMVCFSWFESLSKARYCAALFCRSKSVKHYFLASAERLFGG